MPLAFDDQYRDKKFRAKSADKFTYRTANSNM